MISRKIENEINKQSGSKGEAQGGTKTEIINRIMKKLDRGEYVQEVMRDVVFWRGLKIPGMNLYKKMSRRSKARRLLKQRKKKLYELLDNMDQHVEGKNMQDVTSMFTSLLDIQNQLCLQKTDGIITVPCPALSLFHPPWIQGLDPTRIETGNQPDFHAGRDQCDAGEINGHENDGSSSSFFYFNPRSGL